MFSASFIRSQIFLLIVVLSVALLLLAAIKIFTNISQFSNLRMSGIALYLLIIWLPLGLWLFWNDGKLFDISYAYKQAFLLDPYPPISGAANLLAAGGFAAACAADYAHCEIVRSLIVSVPAMNDQQIGREILRKLCITPSCVSRA